MSKFEEGNQDNPQPGKGFTRTVGNTQYVQGDTTVNTDFDEELARAMGDDPVTELPGDTYKGNANESPEDFFKRALSFRDRAASPPAGGGDGPDDDLDVIEVGE